MNNIYQTHITFENNDVSWSVHHRYGVVGIKT